MSTLAEIEEAVAKLPTEQFSELLRKMQERDAETWDREMEEDAKSGRMVDGLVEHQEIRSHLRDGQRCAVDQQAHFDAGGAAVLSEGDEHG